MTIWSVLPIAAVAVGLWGGHVAHWAWERHTKRRPPHVVP